MGESLNVLLAEAREELREASAAHDRAMDLSKRVPVSADLSQRARLAVLLWMTAARLRRARATVEEIVETLDVLNDRDTMDALAEAESELA